MNNTFATGLYSPPVEGLARLGRRSISGASQKTCRVRFIVSGFRVKGNERYYADIFFCLEMCFCCIVGFFNSSLLKFGIVMINN